MGRIDRCDSLGRDKVEIFGVLRALLGPIHGARQRDSAVYNHRLGLRDPRLSFDPDGHARNGQRLDPTCRSQGVVLSAINRTSTPRSIGADEGFDYLRAGSEATGVDQDLALGVVNRADCEGGTVITGAKQTAMAAPEITDETGSAGESVARASDRATENT